MPGDPIQSAVHIRAARADETRTIAGFQLAMAWETERLALDSETVARGVAAVFDEPRRGQYWIAEEHDRAVGVLLTTPEWSDWRNGEVLWIQSVYIVPEARRRGVFRRFFEHLKRHVVQSGRRGLRLYVERSNHAARATYRALGMRDDHYDTFEWMQ